MSLMSVCPLKVDLSECQASSVGGGEVGVPHVGCENDAWKRCARELNEEV